MSQFAMKNIRTKLRFFTLAAVAMISSVMIAGCDQELIDDATFRLWCGDQLCSWKLDAGHIAQAPTWHKNDHGVELLDTPTTISQELKKSAQCLIFTTIADVEASAQVTVGLDFTGDGIIDYEQPVSATGFREVKTEVTAPRSNVLPRIFITKKGVGRAVLAQIRLQQGSKCSAPALRLHDLPLGSACALGTPSECSSGVCCEGICAECCVAPNGFDVGADGGIATPAEVQCPANGKCERREVRQSTFLFAVAPLQCDPGRKLRPANAICLGDDDCVSNVCEGATSTAFNSTKIVVDGGSTPCPSADFPDAGGGGCSFTTVREGRCR
jgi:hypothetical protein